MGGDRGVGVHWAERRGAASGRRHGSIPVSVRQAGLPPIRLRDLRHGAATLALAAGVEIKVVQEMLRHSSITVTSDTYTSVLPEVARAAAEKTVLIIPRSAQKPLGLVSGAFASSVDGEQMVGEYVKEQVEMHLDLLFGGAPPGTRTPNPLVKSRPETVPGGAE
nr:tyrosine-type recombinase/integrase [Actinocrispum wychmicini]